MDLTIEQALSLGIEAHKSGKIKEADAFYTAILKAQPNHPDANHNLGIIAIGIGKIEEALPFFKRALDANPTKAQFWLSYIDALIKLDRIDDANEFLVRAELNLGSNHKLNEIRFKLKALLQNNTVQNLNLQEPNAPPGVCFSFAIFDLVSLEVSISSSFKAPRMPFSPASTL